jgi:hypothetical protein
MLSEELNRINNSVIRIRNKLNVNTAPIEEVATAVENYKGESDIYRVNTIEEMDRINAKEGNTCMVHTQEVSNFSKDMVCDTLYFPEKIVLDSPLTSSLYTELLYGSNYEEMVRIEISTSSVRFRDYYTYTILASYTSSDATTYTRTTTTESWTAPNVFTPNSYFDEAAIPFMFVKSINFGGLFEYAPQEYYLCETVDGEARKINKKAMESAWFTPWASVVFMYNCELGKDNEVVACDFIEMSVANNDQATAKLQYRTTDDSIYISTQTDGIGISVGVSRYEKGKTSNIVFQSLNTTTLTKFATLNGYDINKCIVFSDQSTYSWDISGLTTLRNQSGTILNPNFKWATTGNGYGWQTLSIGIPTNPENYLFSPNKAFTDIGVVTGKLGTNDCSVSTALANSLELNKGLRGAKPSEAILSRVFEAAIQRNNTYGPDKKPDLEYTMYVPEIDCSEITQVYYNYNSMSEWFYIATNEYSTAGINCNIVHCEGFKDLGKGFRSSDKLWYHTLPPALLNNFDDESLIKLCDSVYDMTGSGVSCAIGADIVIYQRLNNLGLIDKFKAKGWMIGRYKATDENYIVSWNPNLEGNTLSEAASWITSTAETNNRLAGLTFTEDILTAGRLTYPSTSSTCGFGFCTTSEYLPGFTTTATTDLSKKFLLNSRVKKYGPFTIASGTKFSRTFGESHCLEAAPTLNNASYVSTADRAFMYCTSLKDIGQFGNLPNATSVSQMFYGCTGLEEVGAISYPKSTSSSVFTGCTNLRKVGSFSAPAATSVANLFSNCTNLRDVGTCSYKSATSCGSLIYKCPNLTPESIVNILMGLNPAKLSNKGVSSTSMTKEQWNSLSAEQQQTLLNAGFTNDFA